MAGLDHTKFGFYQFQSFLFIVVIVTSVLLKTTFSQISIQGQLLVKMLYGQGKNHLRRLKNIGMASQKLYRNALIRLLFVLFKVNIKILNLQVLIHSGKKICSLNKLFF